MVAAGATLHGMGRKTGNGEGGTAKRRGREERSAARMLGLRKDEPVLVQASPSRIATFYKYLFTLGLYGLWRKRNTSVVTDRRVVMGRGILSREERSIPMSRIVDARYVRRGFHSYATLIFVDRGRHQAEDVGPLSPRRAKSFTNEILEHL